MGTWLQRRLESFLDNCIFAGIVAVVLSIWGYVSKMRGPEIVLVFLFTVVGVLWLLDLIKRKTLSQRSATPAPEATRPPALECRYIHDTHIRGRIINLLDMLAPGGPPVIEGRTVEDCEIKGPAMMELSVVYSFENCRFDAGPEVYLVEVPDKRKVLGPVVIRRCFFKNCKFSQIGIIGPPSIIAPLRERLVGQSVSTA